MNIATEHLDWLTPDQGPWQGVTRWSEYPLGNLAAGFTLIEIFLYGDPPEEEPGAFSVSEQTRVRAWAEPRIAISVSVEDNRAPGQPKIHLRYALSRSFWPQRDKSAKPIRAAAELLRQLAHPHIQAALTAWRETGERPQGMKWPKYLRP
jgi:hypothetical protein